VGAGEHRMRLPAMMDLVLEQMREEPGERLVQHAFAARHRHREIERFIGETRAKIDQPAVDVALGRGERGTVVERLLGIEVAAGVAVDLAARDGGTWGALWRRPGQRGSAMAAPLRLALSPREGKLAVRVLKRRGAELTHPVLLQAQ